MDSLEPRTAPDADHLSRVAAQWATELPHLDTSAVILAGRILRASRYLEREIEHELDRHQLGIHEFNALSALRRAGPPYRLTASALGQSLLFTSGGLAKLLDRLEQAGLVERVADAADRRRVLVCLSEAGRQRQEHAMASHVINEEELLSPLSRLERHELTGLLARLLSAFDAGSWRARPIDRGRLS